MSFPPSFGFYAVLTEPVRGYEYCTRLCVDYEIAFVQLRMKDEPEERIIKTAEKMLAITEGTKTRLIINDDPAVARRVKADGVHLGQNDTPFRESRKIVGDSAIIGLSTHSIEQMENACAMKPDYVGVGPVYATPTKKKPDPVIEIIGMKNMLALSTVPSVAIGGITPENLPLVLEAGARNFCMVRPITQAGDPEKVLKRVLRIYRDFAGRDH
jgi:thiamine-phosphate pyrophosphorylase